MVHDGQEVEAADESRLAGVNAEDPVEQEALGLSWLSCFSLYVVWTPRPHSGCGSPPHFILSGNYLTDIPRNVSPR